MVIISRQLVGGSAVISRRAPVSYGKEIVGSRVEEMWRDKI
jgi:hypothetical protein